MKKYKYNGGRSRLKKNGTYLLKIFEGFIPSRDRMGHVKGLIASIYSETGRKITTMPFRSREWAEVYA